jgi:ribosomal protein S18 acetylase RimI-like enzyme
MDPRVRITRATTVAEVLAAAHLFDEPPRADATRDFLHRGDHHLLLAHLPDDRQPVGFVSGVELVHPDKGCEVFLYELGVDERARGQGVGAALVAALAALARESGCYGMWTLTDADNAAAIATYRRGGAAEPTTHVMPVWDWAPGGSVS